MKKIIFLSFALIFALFSIGAGITVYNLFTTTSNLRKLIDMHEIEDIRQELSYNVQKIQSFTYSPDADFSKRLDEIINHAININESVAQCHSCHHKPEIRAEIDHAEKLIYEFQQRLSYLITTAGQGNWRDENSKQVAELSEQILFEVEAMVNSAAATLQQRTNAAMLRIDRSYNILAFSLLATFFLAIIVARYLMHRITVPIDELLTATTKISTGDFGYQARPRQGDEFYELINTFNEMSRSLAIKEEEIRKHLERLTSINLGTIKLHSASGCENARKEVLACIESLFNVKQKGMIIIRDDLPQAALYLSSDASDSPAELEVSPSSVVAVCQEYGMDNVVLNARPVAGWPFADVLGGLPVENMLVVWMVREKKLVGAVLLINKQDGDFFGEDGDVLGILANNFSIALENIELYRNLHLQMAELQKTQRQLFEAEKLTAVGTLAGGVAHDFNNILCGMIGHIALIKKKFSEDDEEYKVLDMVEKAGFRAADLTKQLLTFSSRNLTGSQPVDLNECARNIISLFKKTISKLIVIELELTDPLPLVMGDAAQIEQVLMNLLVNARDALPAGGTIKISSAIELIDVDAAKRFTEVKPGRYLKITVEDDGTGIDKEILPRIFEPFFTSKEFGKGTGLGLSIVYGIVKSHKGFCLVESQTGKGTVFKIYFPAAMENFFKKDMLTLTHKDFKLEKGILIVDDETIIIKMLSDYLEEIGCKVLVAANGDEAVSLFTKKKSEIDLVILDMNMPVMDGKEAFFRLREIDPKVKILVSSGFSVNEDIRKLMEVDASGFLQKPYSLEDFSSTILKILQPESK
ncbi:MAG: response regulator [Proteobacteria bacterium]|nr:response regulator [Pseudomonadota bacterium]